MVFSLNHIKLAIARCLCLYMVNFLKFFIFNHNKKSENVHTFREQVFYNGL